MRPSVRRERSFVVLALAAATACGHATSPPPTPLPCAYTVVASGTTFNSAGGTGSVAVTTTAGCAWSGRSEAAWLAITSGTAGSGAGSLAFSVAPNADPTRRTGALTVAEQAVTIEQEAAPIACTYTISPAAASIDDDGGAGLFSVTTADSCAWTATSDVVWLTLTGATAGTGSGTVHFTVARNDDPPGRTGTIRAGGQVFTLTQEGDPGACQYSVSPVAFAPCMTAPDMTSQIATAAGCPWTAAPGASWISITGGSSGSGPGTVTFRVENNWDPPRSGVVMVRWPTPTAGQNLQVAQAGCHYAVSRDTIAVPAAGGTVTFDVIQQSEPYTCGGPLQNACVWSAVSDSAWITVTSSMPRTGDDPVSLAVAPNGTGASRSGTVTVRDKSVRITQGG